jgi:hypothetical protein
MKDWKKEWGIACMTHGFALRSVEPRVPQTVLFNANADAIEVFIEMVESQAREAGYQSALEEALGLVQKEYQNVIDAEKANGFNAQGLEVRRDSLIDAIKKLMV